MKHLSFFAEIPARRNLLLALTLASLTFAVYLPVRHYNFLNYDDYFLVLENPYLRAGVTPATVRWALRADWNHDDWNADYWRPASYLSHALDIGLFGMNAGNHHLMSAGLHAAAAAALFWALFLLTGSPWRCAFVAALFALHPLRVESVAWISERKDVLSGLFFFLTIGAYAGYARRPFSLWRYMTLTLLFVLAMMSKPIMVTLPAVLLLLDFWPLGRLEMYRDNGICRLCKSRVILEKIPLFALSGIISMVTFLAQRDAGAVKEGLPAALRIGNTLVSYVTYIGQTLWPVDLAVFYPYNPALPVWKIAAAAALLFVITTCVFWKACRSPYLAVGWLWYLGTLLPVIGLVAQAGGQSHADRYTYIPTIGLYIMAAWGVSELLSRWRWKKYALAACASVILAACVWATSRQLPVWKNDISLFKHALESGHESFPAYNGLGTALAREGRTAEAIPLFREAIRLQPNDCDGHYHLGNALAEEGRTAEAITQYREAIRLQPNDCDAHKNLGLLLAKQNHLTEALKHFREALRLQPDSFEAHANLGAVLVKQGRLTEAIAHYRAALRLKPDNALASDNLQKNLAKQSQMAEGITHLREALRLNPDNAAAQNNLARMLAAGPDAAQRNSAEAVRLAERACELTGYNYPEILDTLATAYAGVGRLSEALKTATLAAEKARAAQNKILSEEIEARLQSYRERAGNAGDF